MIQKNKEYRGLIFDLDGTLVDTVYDLSDSVNLVMKTNNFPELSVEQTRKNIGNGMFKLIQRSVPDEFKNDSIFINQLVEQLIEIYRPGVVNKSVPFKGIKDLLEYCNQNNIPIGVASNKTDNESKLILKTLFPTVTFTSILGHREGNPHKPDPIVVNSILKEMNCSADETLYIGDSYTDFQTAQNGGLDCLLVTYGYEESEVLESIPNTKLIESSQDLRDYLIELLKKNKKVT